MRQERNGEYLIMWEGSRNGKGDNVLRGEM
jgi:hypothetical protein